MYSFVIVNVFPFFSSLAKQFFFFKKKKVVFYNDCNNKCFYGVWCSWEIQLKYFSGKKQFWIQHIQSQLQFLPRILLIENLFFFSQSWRLLPWLSCVFTGVYTFAPRYTLVNTTETLGSFTKIWHSWKTDALHLIKAKN